MVVEIAHDPHTQTGYTFAPAVQALGHARFGDVLLGAVRESVGAELLSAFCLDDGGPRYCLARAIDQLGNPFAECAAQHYVDGYWHSDPGLERLREAHDACGGTVLCQQASNEIRHTGYRAFCYEAPRLIDRVSVLGAVGARRMLFSAYRRAARGPFAHDEVLRFAAHAEMLMSIVGKHVELLEQVRPSTQRDSLAALEGRLASCFAALSLRERQICAGLIVGLSAKEIAQRCGVEVSTVVTYKKRAFEKLGVPNRRALLNLWSGLDRRA